MKATLINLDRFFFQMHQYDILSICYTITIPAPYLMSVQLYDTFSTIQ